ncbi:enoyl-CoA hydratase [Pseudomonadota bacterium]
MSDAEPLVKRHDDGAVATLTLNNPDKLNALSSHMIKALDRHLERLADDTNIRVVILAAAGKAFSAGHDLKELIAHPDHMSAQDFFEDSAATLMKMSELPQPIIARVHGIAAAAGCQLVAQCDLAIASTNAKFATPGINLGLFCTTPSVPLTRQVGRKAAAEMLYTGGFIDAEHAAKIGLINRAVGAEILDAEIENLALEIASKSPEAIAIGKRALHRHMELPMRDAYLVAGEAMAENMQTDDARTGLKAFTDKRPMPEWKDRTP